MEYSKANAILYLIPFLGNGYPKYGGIGGQGGCVQFTASEDVTMLQLAKKYASHEHSTKSNWILILFKKSIQLSRYRSSIVRGGMGEDSSKVRILGRRGEDKIIKVPIGVTIYDDRKKLLGELNNPGENCLVAGGGVGGCAGCSFIGKRGQERVVTVDLKLIADVGLVNIVCLIIADN